MTPSISSDVIVSVLAKGQRRFVVVCTPTTIPLALLTLGRWASNPEIEFEWQDASKMIFDIYMKAKESECHG